MEPLSLVVMEHGSEWPAHLGPRFMGCVALQQQPSESHEELLRRTYERMGAIERLGGAVDLAVLSCSDDGSRTALEGRVPLARALLAMTLREAYGRVELVARSNTPDRTRQCLMALAGTLTEALAGTSGSVAIRFVDTRSPAPRAGAGRRLRAAVEAPRP